MRSWRFALCLKGIMSQCPALLTRFSFQNSCSNLVPETSIPNVVPQSPCSVTGEGKSGAGCAQMLLAHAEFGQCCPQQPEDDAP